MGGIGPRTTTPTCRFRPQRFDVSGVSWFTDLHATGRHNSVDKEVGQMLLKPSIARESPISRRLRRWAPLLLVVGLTAVALAPGLIAGDRPFQRNLCLDHETLNACAQLWRTAAVGRDEVH
jgi:hypothetical protein